MSGFHLVKMHLQRNKPRNCPDRMSNHFLLSRHSLYTSSCVSEDFKKNLSLFFFLNLLLSQDNIWERLGLIWRQQIYLELCLCATHGLVVCRHPWGPGHELDLRACVLGAWTVHLSEWCALEENYLSMLLGKKCALEKQAKQTKINFFLLTL